MEIRKTQMSELDEVMEVYKAARKFMASQGNPNQWGNTRPPREQVEKDIAMGKSYVCVENGRIEGVFYFAHEEDPTYKVIEMEVGKKMESMRWHIEWQVQDDVKALERFV